VVVIVLTLAGGVALVIVGIVQGHPANVIFGALLLIFFLSALADKNPGGDDDDCGEA
jgi:hypothetical protein